MQADHFQINGSGILPDGSSSTAKEALHGELRFTHICSAVALSNSAVALSDAAVTVTDAEVTAAVDSNAAEPRNSRACEGGRGCNMKPDAAVAACRLMEHFQERANTHKWIIAICRALLRCLLGARDP
jgi:hypothetical protein